MVEIVLKKLAHWEDLFYFLQVNGFDVSREEAQEKFRIEPARKETYDRYFDHTNETEPGEISVMKALEVWENTSNHRASLWTDGVVAVYTPEDDDYRFIDPGRELIKTDDRRIGDVFILFSFDEHRDLIKRGWFFLRDKTLLSYPLRYNISLTLKALQCYVEEGEAKRKRREEERKRFDEERRRLLKEKEDEEVKALPVNEKRRLMAERFEQGEVTVANMHFKEQYLLVGDQRFGIKGIDLREYFDKDDFLESVADPEEMLEKFYLGMWFEVIEKLKDVTETTAVKAWLGSFPVIISARVKKVPQKNTDGEERFSYHCRFYIEGEPTTLESLRYALERGIRYDDRRKFMGLLRDLRANPPAVRKYLEEGLKIKVDKDKIVIPVRRENGKNFFVWEKHWYLVPGGITTLKNLEKGENIGSLHDLFDELSSPKKGVKGYPIMPRDVALAVVREAVKRREEAERKSRELVNEVLTKYGTRVKEAVFGNMPGFIVKGNVKNFFIERNKLGVYSYPQGDYMCVVDKGEGADLSRNDRLVTRILMLLNDNKFMEQIYTLKR